MSDPAMLRAGAWCIRGKVVHGHGRGGSQLGFPTANVQLDESTIQALGVMENGVYFGWAQVEAAGATPPAPAPAASASASTDVGSVLPMVMSVGFNPHFRDKALTVEIHFIHKFSHDFYDETVRALVVGHIRDQSSYESLEKLIATIKEDCRIAVDSLTTTHAALQRAHFFRETLSSAPFLALPASKTSIASNM